MEKELKLLGLNDTDIKAYLTLLQLGESSASKIAQNSGIPRASIYDVLERLINEGLISYIVKDFKKYFIAAEPSTIIDNLEYKKKRLKDIIPKLEGLKKEKIEGVPETEVYTGIKGMQTVLNLILKEKKIFALGTARKTYEIMPFFMNKWHKERVKRKIPLYAIYYDTKKIRDSMKNTKDYLGIGKGYHYRFLNIHYFSPFMTIIFKDRVFLALWEENPSGILIKSSEIAETNKRYFLSLWKLAKK